MAQKIVIKVSMADEKTRTEVMKIAASVGGVIKSVTIEGADRDEIVVVGSGVDSVKLTAKLRKRMGFVCSLSLAGLCGRRAGSVQLLSVAAAEEKKTGEKKEDKEGGEDPAVAQPCACTTVPLPPYQLYEVCEPPHYYTCRIL